MTTRDALSSPAGLYIPFDRSASAPYYQQIYHGLLAAILDGRLRQGQRLPSTRALAIELGVSRLPVLSAYEQLLHEGYLTGRVGAGTYVAPAVPRWHDGGRSSRERRPRQSRDRHGTAGVRADPSLPPALGVFRVGLPALDQFPRTAWSRLVARHARQLSIELMAYGEAGGYLPLRSAVAAYLRAARGVSCEPAQVLIVAGSQMALRLCAAVLLKPGDVVAVENPGYPGAWSALTATGAMIRGVPVDDGGMVVRALGRKTHRDRLVYVTPSHQYPLGMAMAASRRLELVEWARRHDGWIVEDDYDSEYRFTSRPLGALQGMDGAGRVIYMGTFSKVLFPALRLGYVVVPEGLIARFLQQRDILDLFSPTLYQSALTDFISHGHFARHIRRMRLIYQQRRDALVGAIRRRLGDRLEIVNADAGMHLCARLAPGTDDVSVVERAAARGLSPIALSTCFVDGATRPGLVLGFGGSMETQIVRSVDILADAIEEAGRRRTPQKRML
jgi:GntR family transcriptional regulator/MocR family aminotransferase